MYNRYVKKWENLVLSKTIMYFLLITETMQGL